MPHAAEAHTGQAAASADPMVPRPFRIDGARRETSDTLTVEIRPMDTGPASGCGFSPGQFNMLYVFGIGEIPISISGDPNQTGFFQHTTRAVGAVTKALCALKRGDALGVRGPFGAGWPVKESEGQDLVLVAGGIGLAPLRPVLCDVLAKRERYGRVVLLYGTRSPEDILFRRELEQWRGRFDLEVFVTVDRAMQDWRGHVGVVTRLVGRAPFDPLNATTMVCGPEIMMRFAAEELVKRGVPKELIFVSMERNMKCAVGFCGHCQFGPEFICKNGPVFRLDRVSRWLGHREV
jgi:NAD(P)H-flavin reductase